jgi:hypothetical protein
VLAGAGCAKTPSDDVLTSGIYADIDAQADGDGSTLVTATLYVGAPENLDFVEIDGTDQLFAIFDSAQVAMTQVELGNIVGHQASFANDAEGDEFVVDFMRTVDAGAPMSVATLPAPFTFGDTPTAASRAADLTLTWTSDDSADDMTWSATGECIADATGAVAAADTATMLTIPANTLIGAGSGVPDSCTITVQVARTQQGTLDPGYGQGGTIVGVQARSVQLTSNP